MKPIDTTSAGPINDLFLAINHYVSTGDHIGEGVALEGHDGGLLFQILYDRANPDDRDDARRLRVRLDEIRAAHPELPSSLEDAGSAGRFSVLLLHVRPGDARRLAAHLVRSCGEAGWGTGKPLIDEHFPDVRIKLLSGEGV